MLQTVRRSARDGLDDLMETLRGNYRTAILGWQEIATRYQRSRVGPFWLTINKGVLIAALSLVFGTLFGLEVDYFIPYLAIGLILWTFIAATLGDGCRAFSDSAGTILHVRIPLSTLVAIALYRNILILAHNAVIIPLVFLLFLRPVGWEALLALPGLALLWLNLGWMCLLLAVICARFRDVTEIVNNVLQVLFYLTPIIWTMDLIRDRVQMIWVVLNPFYHLIEVIRAPLLGEPVAAVSWLVTATLAMAGWALALPFFGHYRKRVPYWL